jgi:hypothetical protein
MHSFLKKLQAAVGLADSFDQVKAQGITRGRWAWATPKSCDVRCCIDTHWQIPGICQHSSYAQLLSHRSEIEIHIHRSIYIYIYLYVYLSLIWEAARLCLCTPMHHHVCMYCTKFLAIKLQGFGEDPGRRSWQWSFEWKGAECRGVCFDFLGEEFNVGHGGACFW